MQENIKSLPVVMITVALALLLTALLAIYVYKDAKRQRQHPLKWTLIVVLVPGFIGLIIYAVARKRWIKKRMICPACREQLADIQHFCPQCAYAFTPEDDAVEASTIDRSSGKLLWAVLGVSIAIILLASFLIVGNELTKDQQTHVEQKQIQIEGLKERCGDNVWKYTHDSDGQTLTINVPYDTRIRFVMIQETGCLHSEVKYIAVDGETIDVLMHVNHSSYYCSCDSVFTKGQAITIENRAYGFTGYFGYYFVD